MTEELEEYILRHIDKEGETLSRLTGRLTYTICDRGCVPDTCKENC